MISTFRYFYTFIKHHQFYIPVPLRFLYIICIMPNLNDTTQPVDREEEGRSPTTDRQWLIERKTCQTYILILMQYWNFVFAVVLLGHLAIPFS